MGANVGFRSVLFNSGLSSRLKAKSCLQLDVWDSTFGTLGAASCFNRLSPVWVLPPSWCACHTLWNLGSSFQHPPWPALTSTSTVVCLQCVPMAKNLTVSSTWTPTAAMPSAFYWPLLVPCAPAGLRRQLTSSLGFIFWSQTPCYPQEAKIRTRSF